MALLFEKPSLRTRVSFEAGMIHLGGSSLFLGDDVGLRRRESMADFGRVLSQYVDVVVVRANRHKTVLDLARYCTCSVINGLTDYGPSLPGLGRSYTRSGRLFGRLKGRTLAYIGDGNNVARSLAEGCGKVGMRFCHGDARGIPVRAGIFSDQLTVDVPRARHCTSPTDPAEAVARGDCRLHRRLDQHGTGDGDGRREAGFLPLTRSTPS